MEANELRTGNYAQSSKGEIFQCNVDDITMCFLALKKNIRNIQYNPIPLTEQWLKDLGCKAVRGSKPRDFKYYEIPNKKPCKHILIKTDGTFFSIFNHSECDREQTQFIRPVEFVHTFQNVCFYLTDKELIRSENHEIKPITSTEMGVLGMISNNSKEEQMRMSEPELKALSDNYKDKFGGPENFNKVLFTMASDGMTNAINKKRKEQGLCTLEEAETITWFIENFDEKDRREVARLLAEAVIKSAATIDDLHMACMEIKTIFPEHDELRPTLLALREMSNKGCSANRAGKALAEKLKKQ